jgi:epoxyqueuosine reductase
MNTHSDSITSQIKSKAYELGFDACGIAPAGEVDTGIKTKFSSWLSEGRHGKMQYMENYLEKRMNPALLVPGAKSVICLAMNYHQRNFQPENSQYKVSQYAAGKDYHNVIKKKLYLLLEFIATIAPENKARVFTDSAPVLERYWAQKSGLGAIGKNACLILPRKGSYFFLSEIIIDIELDYNTPFEKDPCGKCTRCIDACPTGAILSPGVIDAKSCTSYLTIELKDEIPDAFKGKTADYIFGCDICQDVCPHNIKFAAPTKEPEFAPIPAISEWANNEWEIMDKPSYRQNFLKTGSPVARAAFKKLKGNISFVRNSHYPEK